VLGTESQALALWAATWQEELCQLLQCFLGKQPVCMKPAGIFLTASTSAATS
jgi:hypothetical protein